MARVIVAAILLGCLACTSIAADSTSIEIMRVAELAAQDAPAAHFAGRVKLVPLLQPSGASRLSGASVSFEPGARTVWHTHPAGQTLIVTSGVGLIAEWGGPVREMRAGDVVRIPPGVKHWHGATRTSAMTHLAFQEAVDGEVVTWLEAVVETDVGTGSRQQH